MSYEQILTGTFERMASLSVAPAQDRSDPVFRRPLQVERPDGIAASPTNVAFGAQFRRRREVER